MNNSLSFRIIPRAFTLIEMLVVIVIISMLATLITAASQGVLRTARQSTISMAIHQVDIAVQNYKNKYGEYPADFSDKAAVVKHFHKRFPRAMIFSNPVDTNNDGIENDLLTDVDGDGNLINEWYDCICTKYRRVSGFDIKTASYGSSLAFWLGGMPDNAGKFYTGTVFNPTFISNTSFNSLKGFSANPENPFDTSVDDSVLRREPPLLELEVGKNIAIVQMKNADDEDTVKDTVSPWLWAYKGPIVYFKARPSANPAYSVNQFAFGALWYEKSKATGLQYKFSDMNTWTGFYPGTARPYMKNKIIDGVGVMRYYYYNEQTYQLIHPGLDGIIGPWNPVSNSGQYGSTVIGTEDTHDVYPNGTWTNGNVIPLADENIPIIQGEFSGNACVQFDSDNVVNFAEGGTIQSIMP